MVICGEGVSSPGGGRRFFVDDIMDGRCECISGGAGLGALHDHRQSVRGSMFKVHEGLMSMLVILFYLESIGKSPHTDSHSS